MKDACDVKTEVKLEEEIIADAKNGDSSLISRDMVEEEEKLMEARVKEEDEELKKEESANLKDSQFTKLDELLTQTQLYSEFLLEKMDDITIVFFHTPFPAFFVVGHYGFIYFCLLFMKIILLEWR